MLAVAPPPYTLPCPPGTPAAVRIAGLPRRIELGPEERFSLERVPGDWAPAGAIRVTMRSRGAVFYDGVASEPESGYFLQLDLGDRGASVTAAFLQAPAQGGADPCVATVSARVRGYRRFRLAGVHRPQAVPAARLRALRWRHWNRARATASGRLGGRSVRVVAFRVRGGQGRPYRYTRLLVDDGVTVRTLRV